MCNDCLKHIVVNEKMDSEHEDDSEIVELREDKVGSLFVQSFTFLISIFDEKVLVVRLFYFHVFSQLTAARFAHDYARIIQI